MRGPRARTQPRARPARGHRTRPWSVAPATAGISNTWGSGSRRPTSSAVTEKTGRVAGLGQPEPQGPLVAFGAARREDLPAEREPAALVEPDPHPVAREERTPGAPDLQEREQRASLLERHLDPHRRPAEDGASAQDRHPVRVRECRDGKDQVGGERRRGGERQPVAHRGLAQRAPSGAARGGSGRVPRGVVHHEPKVGGRGGRRVVGVVGHVEAEPFGLLEPDGHREVADGHLGRQVRLADRERRLVRRGARRPRRCPR